MNANGLDIIFLDAGGTLLYPDPGVGEVYARAGRRHGVLASAPELEAAFRDAFREKKATGEPQGEAWWRDVVARTFGRFGTPRNPEPLFRELFDHFAGGAAWNLFPGVLDAVLRMKDMGCRTGLISNWDERLPEVLDGHGLLPHLDPVVISAVVGAEKPDPRIFRAALDAAGVPPERALMVGDDREADYEGARAVGMSAVLVDWRGRLPGGPEVLSSLDELVARL